ncbi:MAG: hypothetical protein KKE17_02040 [Proteobacteria bacterium]|nr:hypothetical protein [Pseudomonadota bacterium]MBU1708762.1 hypothetical protein [Pseudomonadota bacterium]
MIDPAKFGLPPRTVIQETTPGNFAIVIHRKSRIIMADGRKILEKIQKISAQLPDAQVVLQTSAPICSKTKAFLQENGVAMKS